MMNGSESGKWQTVKSKTEEKKKRQDDKRKDTPVRDRLGVAVDPAKQIFASIDKAFGKASTTVATDTSTPEKAAHGDYSGAFTGLEVHDHVDSPTTPTTPVAANGAGGPFGGGTDSETTTQTPVTTKAKKPKIKKPKITVAQVAEGINIGELEQLLRDLKDRYRGNDLSQLQVLADHLMKQFREVELPFNNLLTERLEQATEVPVGEVPEALSTALGHFVHSKPDGALAAVVVTLLAAAVEGLPEGAAKTTTAKLAAQPPRANVGLLLFLAIILRARPGVLVLCSPQLLAAGRQFSAPGRILHLLWALNQARTASPAAALAAWVRVLLPQLLGQDVTPRKPATAAAATDGGAAGGATADGKPAHVAPLDAGSFEVVTFYGSTLLSDPAIAGSAESGRSTSGNSDVPLSNGQSVPVVPAVYVEAVSRSVDDSCTSLARPIKSRLQAMHLLLVDVAATSAIPQQYSEWLPMALETASLSTAAPEGEGDALVARAAASVVLCLEHDDACFRVWELKHRGHIKGSARVLQHLLHCYSHSQAGPLMDRLQRRPGKAQQLRQLLEALPARHKTFLASGKGWQGACAASSEQACTGLLKRLQRGGAAALQPALVAGVLLISGGVMLTVAAYHNREVAALAHHYIGADVARPLHKALQQVHAVVAPVVDPALAALQPHVQAAVDAVQPHVQTTVEGAQRWYADAVAPTVRELAQHADVATAPARSWLNKQFETEGSAFRHVRGALQGARQLWNPKQA